MEEQEILSVSNLQTDVQTHNGLSPLIKDISFQLKKGKILGIVGESGCGKTVTSMSILQLHNKQTMQVQGSIQLKGQELNGIGEKNMRSIRGKEVAFIMQNPMNAFTPIFTIGQQFIETLQTHLSLSKKEAVELAIETMQSVNLKDPKELMKKYPFELSGGMLQRVMIAITASLKPALIVADEPTTALIYQVNYLYYGYLRTYDQPTEPLFC